MTLSTHIRVLEPTDPKALHDWCNTNLLHALTPAMEIKEDSIWNECGQGLSAWLISRHAKGAELEHALDPEDYAREYYDTDAEYEIDQARVAASPTGYVDLDFDTTYGYKWAGGGCTELHASFIVRLKVEYFDPKGLTFMWKNEYSGEWFTGLDGLEKFLNTGDDAMSWYNTDAKPAIDREITASEQSS